MSGDAQERQNTLGAISGDTSLSLLFLTLHLSTMRAPRFSDAPRRKKSSQIVASPRRPNEYNAEMNVRNLTLIRAARPTLEGAGVHLRRAFGNGDESLFDPFLMLDDFRADDPSRYRPGFPWHPHRGIETITYVIEGEVDHSDSLGNEGTIRAGDVQWMTAGSGVIHQEMPRGDQHGRMGGFQLWANLPAAHKLMTPRYQSIQSSEIPEVEWQGAHVRVIAGSMGGVAGPVSGVMIEPEYYDVSVPAGETAAIPTEPAHSAFAYLFEGEADFGTPPRHVVADPGTVVRFGEGNEVVVASGPRGARLLLAAGRPLHEPIAWRGPIVMNYPRELDEAWRDLSDGTFVRTGPKDKP